jgi:predicted Zn-dependent protease
MIRAVFTICAALALSGCIETAEIPTAPQPANLKTLKPQKTPSAQAARSFLAVVARVEPVAERECRARSTGINCNMHIVVDDNPKLPPNAFQTFDKNRQPVIIFTQALIADVRNPDELAFILGHEAAHLIRGHIPKTQQSAMAGAVLGGLLAATLGAGDAAIETAQQVGGAVGARSFSKTYELEADELGTIIAAHAGYDPLKGAAYFSRIPDPGNKVLGTHPRNSARIAVVRRTAANM